MGSAQDQISELVRAHSPGVVLECVIQAIQWEADGHADRISKVKYEELATALNEALERCNCIQIF